MGAKAKVKTAQKKAAKKILKAQGKKSDITSASKVAGKAKSQGLDLAQLASSTVSSIPIVGGLASGLIDQTLGTTSDAGVQMQSTGRGGRRGVMLVDSKLGNLGTISRAKALGILVNRNRRPPVRRQKQVAIIRSGEQVVKV